MARSAQRRLGRPPASNSTETRQRILDAARETFAELGWDVTTNKDIATKAGITSGAALSLLRLARHLPGRAHAGPDHRRHARFSVAMEASDTFIGQLDAVLEAAHELNARDPSLARFVASACVDLGRHADLRRKVGQRARAGEDSISKLVETAVETGAVDPSRRAELAAFLRTVLVGLTDALSGDLAEHQTATTDNGAVFAARCSSPRVKAPSGAVVAVSSNGASGRARSRPGPATPAT